MRTAAAAVALRDGRLMLRVRRGRMSPGPLVAASCGLRIFVMAPDAVVFREVGELAGDLFAVRLVMPADFPDEVAGVLANSGAPGADLISGCGYRQWLGRENLLRVLLEQRVDGAAGAACVGVG